MAKVKYSQLKVVLQWILSRKSLHGLYISYFKSEHHKESRLNKIWVYAWQYQLGPSQ